MAYGDGTLAAAAGIPACSGAGLANTLDTEVTKTRDYLGEMKVNLPRKITVSATAPASPVAGDVWIKVV